MATSDDHPDEQLTNDEREAAHETLYARLLASDEVRAAASSMPADEFAAWLAANVRRISDEQSRAQQERIAGTERNFARAVRGTSVAVWLDIRRRAEWRAAMRILENE